jgi:hypothetical protein
VGGGVSCKIENVELNKRRAYECQVRRQQNIVIREVLEEQGYIDFNATSRSFSVSSQQGFFSDEPECFDIEGATLTKI